MPRFFSLIRQIEFAARTRVRFGLKTQIFLVLAKIQIQFLLHHFLWSVGLPGLKALYLLATFACISWSGFHSKPDF